MGRLALFTWNLWSFNLNVFSFLLQFSSQEETWNDQPTTLIEFRSAVYLVISYPRIVLHSFLAYSILSVAIVSALPLFGVNELLPQYTISAFRFNTRRDRPQWPYELKHVASLLRNNVQPKYAHIRNFGTSNPWNPRLYKKTQTATVRNIFTPNDNASNSFSVPSITMAHSADCRTVDITTYNVF